MSLWDVGQNTRVDRQSFPRRDWSLVCSVTFWQRTKDFCVAVKNRSYEGISTITTEGEFVTVNLIYQFFFLDLFQRHQTHTQKQTLEGPCSVLVFDICTCTCEGVIVFSSGESLSVKKCFDVNFDLVRVLWSSVPVVCNHTIPMILEHPKVSNTIRHSIPLSCSLGPRSKVTSSYLLVNGMFWSLAFKVALLWCY